MKKQVLFIILILLHSCGFNPIYSTKDSNYKVISFEKNINNNLTSYIQNSINMLSNENAQKIFNIKFEFNEIIEVILKNSKGNPLKNRINISVDLYLYDSSKNLISSKTFNENFEYNISDNKLNLREYEKNIKLNLVDEITQQILIFLASS